MKWLQISEPIKIKFYCHWIVSKKKKIKHVPCSQSYLKVPKTNTKRKILFYHENT